MKYSIVYSSRTGNTEMLADSIRKTLDPKDCVYYGPVSDEALKADLIYIGFWTDKGHADDEATSLMKKITDQKVFLFGTCGFGGGQAYFDQILARSVKFLNSDVEVTGTYMCQGKMPMSVRDRYVSMQKAPGMGKKMQSMIENFDQALSHPDKEDLDRLVKML